MIELITELLSFELSLERVLGWGLGVAVVMGYYWLYLWSRNR